MQAQSVTRTKKRYDAAFKKEAIRLSDSSGKKDREIEQDLGLYPNAADQAWLSAVACIQLVMPFVQTSLVSSSVEKMLKVNSTTSVEVEPALFAVAIIHHRYHASSALVSCAAACRLSYHRCQSWRKTGFVHRPASSFARSIAWARSAASAEINVSILVAARDE